MRKPAVASAAFRPVPTICLGAFHPVGASLARACMRHQEEGSSQGEPCRNSQALFAWILSSSYVIHSRCGFARKANKNVPNLENRKEKIREGKRERNCQTRQRQRSKTKTQHDVHAHRLFSPSYLQRAKEDAKDDVTRTLLPSSGGGQETRWQPSQLSIAGAHKM